MKLNELHDNPGATRKKKRVARGPGSGKGKTAGRGIKGQKSRSGVALNAYEGGQMPLYMRLPKRGFNNRTARHSPSSTSACSRSSSTPASSTPRAEITEDVLVASGLVRRKLDGVRVLGKGALTAKLTMSVTGASKSAVEAVEKAGGTLTRHRAEGRSRGRMSRRMDLSPPVRRHKSAGLSRRRARKGGGGAVTSKGSSWHPQPNRWRPTSAGAPSARPRTSRAASSSPSAS